MDRDIIIIGGGPGGYVAAIRAAQLGANVSVIEDKKIGGTCLNKGCIPTKALYKNAQILDTLSHIEDFGISVDNYKINVEKIQSRKQEVVDTLVGGIEKVLDSYNVEVIDGFGTFKDKNTITITLKDGSTKELTAKNIIIASGSEPTMPNLPGIDLDGVINSDDILEFTEVPKRLLIVGSGVIGLEFAGIFNSLGSEVVVYSSTFLKNADKDISKRLASYMKRQGIKIIDNIRAKEINKTETGLEVVGMDKRGKKDDIKYEADMVLVASGRSPLVKGLNLDGIGVEYDHKGVKINHSFETNVEGVHAIGDVTGGMLLAHVASHHGISAVEKIMGLNPMGNHDVVPNCVFVTPEVAHVGLTEDEAKEKGLDIKVSKFMFGANGKALAMGEGDGLVKVISEGDDNKIIGVHILGPHASSLIHEGALAISKELNADDIGNTIHAHPTLGEAFLEAVLGLKGEAIHAAAPRKR